MCAGHSAGALAACEMFLRRDPRTPWHNAIVIGRAQALFQRERHEGTLPLSAHSELAFPVVAPAIGRIVAICHLRMSRPGKARAKPADHGPVTANEEFLISRHRNTEFRPKLRDGIAMLAGPSTL